MLKATGKGSVNIIIEVLSALDPLLKMDQSVPLYDNQTVAYKFEVAGGLDCFE